MGEDSRMAGPGKDMRMNGDSEKLAWKRRSLGSRKVENDFGTGRTGGVAGGGRNCYGGTLRGRLGALRCGAALVTRWSMRSNYTVARGPQTTHIHRIQFAKNKHTC